MICRTDETRQIEYKAPIWDDMNENIVVYLGNYAARSNMEALAIAWTRPAIHEFLEVSIRRFAGSIWISDDIYSRTAILQVSKASI